MFFNTTLNIHFLQNYQCDSEDETNLKLIQLDNNQEKHNQLKLFPNIKYPILFQEFSIFDIDKLHNNKKYRNKLPNNFSVLVGFKRI